MSCTSKYFSAEFYTESGLFPPAGCVLLHCIPYLSKVPAHWTPYACKNSFAVVRSVFFLKWKFVSLSFSHNWQVWLPIYVCVLLCFFFQRVTGSKLELIKWLRRSVMHPQTCLVLKPRVLILLLKHLKWLVFMMIVKEGHKTRSCRMLLHCHRDSLEEVGARLLHAQSV